MIRTSEPFSEFLEEIRKALAPYTKVQNRIKATIGPALAQFAEIQRQANEIMAPLNKILGPIIKRAKEIEEEHGSVSNYLNKLIEERHKVLAEYGWFYAFGISDDLADEVFNQQSELSHDDVDTIVTDFFAKDDYAALLMIIAEWKHSPYFASRQHIFDEALANHMHKRFYSSVTLLSVHTEGVISDYVRKEATARFSFENCIRDLNQLLNDRACTAYFPSIERKVLFDFLTDVCTSSFWHENPDIQDPHKTNGLQLASYNLSRNKIAHGHVIRGLTEVDSIKCFLYLNALCYLFFELGQDGDSDE